MLRYRADVKTLIYMVIITSLFFYLWNADDLSGWVWGILYTFHMLFAVSASVIAHNHNHLPIWKNKFLNVLQDNWITIFYGFPAWAWIPTHNKNHHRHVNTEPDYTRTWRLTEKNNLLTLLSYPSISGRYQQPALIKYMQSQWKNHRTQFWLCMLQVVVLLAWVGTGLAIDWYKAVIYMLIPQQFSLFSVLVFNYVQHIHADELSEYNNSRNITGKMLNFCLFNNGYHTAHHQKAGLHWSELPEEHRRIAHHIKPELNEVSFFGFLIKTYILGIFMPSMRTRNMRLSRIQNQETATA